MTDLTTFTFPKTETAIRVIMLKGEPWFVVADVGDALGMANARRTARRCCATDEFRSIALRKGPGRPHLLISESGLYKLIMRSDKPEARAFQDWVTRDVLPAIRKDGAYVMGEEKVKTGELSEDEFLLKAFDILQAKVERLTAEKARLAAQNDKLSGVIEEHLDYMTINEFGATGHVYLDPSERGCLARRAVRLCKERNITLQKQERDRPIYAGPWKKRKMEKVSINVYPRLILKEAARQIGLTRLQNID